ncbi:hypothetical protein PPERSA_06813 [Pseudocohnilembus persalinus]|uniref:Uncharacterized protein n=1 Tax=Pseudocohnilembus persalinus TaxID=266149 RepID=A0A0V0QSK2_PSEPJ|nr:hypothetical protein PPERSA_06813 [Pseudocohnilembus persalinus]|eukprot:KRX05179.1 hypothetical protein PPERSA_06813 [Pseudocohnilembus persalinus]
MEKEKTDHRLDLALKEHELHMKQDQEVFQIIQLEQAAYDEFDNLKKEEKQEIKNQKKMESKQIQEQIMQQQDLLQDLQQELHKLTSQLNGVQNVNELIPQLEDLQQTNKYCIEQKDSLVKEKEQMRQLIIEEEQELYKVKCEALNIPENDQLIQNYQETTLIDTFKKKQKLIQETKELKEKLNSKNLELKNTNDVSIQLINGITGLMNGLEQNQINEEQIEDILLNKYKEHDQPEDSFQGLKDIEQPQSDSSYDFGNSQVEIIA